MPDVDVSAEVEGLPILYQHWLQSILPGGMPRERVATCLDCAMCARTPEEQQTMIGAHNPDTKCCTYFPNVPNYLVGRAIDVDTPGARVMLGYVESGTSSEANVTLHGVAPTGKRSGLYDLIGSTGGFGRDPDLLCPYAIEVGTREGPLCGIWEHRNSVCSTYFCKHVNGGSGRHLWMAIRNLFRHIESSLSWWAIAQLVPELGPLLLRPPTQQEERIDSTLSPEAWNYWSGTRADFYRACSEKVEALSWEEVVSVVGFKAALYVEEVCANYDHVYGDTFPDPLRPTAFTTIRAGHDRTTIQGRGGGGSEHVVVPTTLLRLLPYFDGRPTEDVLSDIKAQERVGLDVALVRKLYDFGILERADA